MQMLELDLFLHEIRDGTAIVSAEPGIRSRREVIPLRECTIRIIGPAGADCSLAIVRMPETLAYIYGLRPDQTGNPEKARLVMPDQNRYTATIINEKKERPTPGSELASMRQAHSEMTQNLAIAHAQIKTLVGANAKLHDEVHRLKSAVFESKTGKPGNYIGKMTDEELTKHVESESLKEEKTPATHGFRILSHKLTPAELASIKPGKLEAMASFDPIIVNEADIEDLSPYDLIETHIEIDHRDSLSAAAVAEAHEAIAKDL